MTGFEMPSGPHQSAGEPESDGPSSTSSGENVSNEENGDSSEQQTFSQELSEERNEETATEDVDPQEQDEFEWLKIGESVREELFSPLPGSFVGGSHGNINNHYYDAGARPIHADRFNRLNQRDLERRHRTMGWPDGLIEETSSSLARWRCLVLVGEQELGKASIAIETARVVTELATEEAEIYRIKSIDRELLFDPGQIFGALEQEKTRGPRTLILENAWAHSNPSVIRFLRSLDEPGVASFRNSQREANTYLVLTGKLAPEYREVIASIAPGVVKQIDRLSHAQLLHVLRQCKEKRLEEWRREGLALSQAELEQLRRLIEENADRIVRAAPKMPLIGRFVEHELLRILHGERELEEALEPRDPAEEWLLRELPSTPRLWTFVLALTLASPGNETLGPVPWLQFQALWTRVDRALRPRPPSSERPAINQLYPAVDDRLVEAAGAVIVRSFTQYHARSVRFEDPSRAEDLWRVLLGSGRGILGQLTSVLENLAEHQDPYLRQAGARALGRAGEFDFSYFFLPKIQRWSRAKLSDAAGSVDVKVVGA